MRSKLALGIAVLVVLCGVAVAQGPGGGMAPGADMGMPDMGGSWTGTLQKFDQATRTITLAKDHKGKQETFSAVIGPNVQYLDSKGKPEEGRNLEIGEKLRVYYKEAKTQSGDRQNVISRIDMLDKKPDKKSK